VWDADPVRGPRDTARQITVVVIVLSALGLIALAARSDRASTLAPRQVTAAPAVEPPAAETPTPAPDGGRAGPAPPAPVNRPSWPVWFVAILITVPLLIALAFSPAVFWISADGTWFSRRPREPAEPAEVDDEVTPPPLADAIAEGLRELDQGGPGEGVVACWVRLERAAADAGTRRAATETASELASRLIDRHPVSSDPLLRLADVYQEARYSRHQLPESACTEARAALEQLRAELVE
jgi:Domain of unknown function (DUF4129)